MSQISTVGASAIASTRLLTTHHFTRLLRHPLSAPEPSTLPAITDRFTAWLLSRFAQPT